MAFLDDLQKFLDTVTDEITYEDIRKADQMVRERADKNVPILTVACLNCASEVQISKKNERDYALAQKRWTNPPKASSKYGFQLCGAHIPHLKEWLCLPCQESFLDQWIAMGRAQIEKEKLIKSAMIEEEVAAVLEGEIKERPKGRFDLLVTTLTDQDVDDLERMPYRMFLETPYWKTVRAYKLVLAGYQCQLCNKGGRLSVHHRTYEHRGCEYLFLEDLIVLCDPCHAKHHNKLPPP